MRFTNKRVFASRGGSFTNTDAGGASPLPAAS
jgi:hypothetical protein